MTDEWLSETNTPGLLMATDINSGHTEPVFAGATAPRPLYEIRCYDPRFPEGYTHRASRPDEDLEALKAEVDRLNAKEVSEVAQGGFEQWWITENGVIIYPRQFVKELTELDESIAPLKDIQATKDIDTLYDLLFSERLDNAQRRERLLVVVQEMAKAAMHIRNILEEE